MSDAPVQEQPPVMVGDFVPFGHVVQPLPGTAPRATGMDHGDATPVGRMPAGYLHKRGEAQFDQRPPLTSL